MEKHLSRNLKSLLLQHTLSSAELSHRIGVAQPVLHRLITGAIDNPQINTLLPLCEYFNCTLDALIFGSFTSDATNQYATACEIKHKMRNSVTTINSFLQGLEKALPVFAQSYLILPHEFRTGEISEQMVHMIPSMLNHSINAIAALREAINDL